VHPLPVAHGPAEAARTIPLVDIDTELELKRGAQLLVGEVLVKCL
jgi:hypothetical protein